MKTLVIHTKKSDNADFILKLVKKLGETGAILTDEKAEDFLLGTIMKNEKTGVKVSRTSVFKKLKKPF